jgi:hypothetical protein
MTEMSRSFRVSAARAAVLGAAAVPALVLGGPAALAGDAAEAGVRSVADCTSLDLEVTETDRGAAAGTTYVEFTFTKKPPRSPWADEACVMYGDLVDMYWGDQEGHEIGAHAVRDGEGGDPFALFPGDTAKVTVATPNVGNFDPEECRPTEVMAANFFLKNDYGVAWVLTDDVVCANPEVGGPRVSPVTPA